MEDIAFEELVRRVQNNLLAGQGRINPDQVHRVLKLVSETESAAGLIKSAARPNAFGQGLIFEPVLEEIKFRIVGFDLKGFHEAKPPLPGFLETFTRGINAFIFLNQLGGLLPVIGLSQNDGDRGFATRRNFQGPQKSRDLAFIRQLRGIRFSFFHHVGMRGAPVRAEKPAAFCLHAFRGQRHGGKSPTGTKDVALIGVKQGVQCLIVARLERARSFRHKGQRHLKIGSYSHPPRPV